MGKVKRNKEVFLTLKEVAQYLRMNYRTVHRLAEKGEIPAFRIGKSWRVKKDILDKWIEEQIKKSKRRRNNAFDRRTKEYSFR